MNSNEQCICAGDEYDIQAGLPMTCDECIKDMLKTGEIECKTPTPPADFADILLNQTEYCDKCEEEVPIEWGNEVCESCWEKNKPVSVDNNIISLKPPMSWLLNWEMENLKREHKLKEFYIDRDKYHNRETTRKLETKKERKEMRDAGATEKEIHKWGQKHRRNTNDRFNRFFNKWEEQIKEDYEIQKQKENF